MWISPTIRPAADSHNSTQVSAGMRAPLPSIRSRFLRKQRGILSRLPAHVRTCSGITILNCLKGIQAGFRVRNHWPRVHTNFTEYMVDKLGVTDVGAKWDGLLTYHPSCHTLRGINVDKQPRTAAGKYSGVQPSWICHMLKNAAASAVSCLWSTRIIRGMVEAQNKQFGNDPIPYFGCDGCRLSHAHRRRLESAEEKNRGCAYCGSSK